MAYNNRVSIYQINYFIGTLTNFQTIFFLNMVSLWASSYILLNASSISHCNRSIVYNCKLIQKDTKLLFQIYTKHYIDVNPCSTDVDYNNIYVLLIALA